MHAATADQLSEIVGPTLRATPAGGLTFKEAEVVLWTGEGKDTEETAVILGISTRAVKARIANSFYKLRANTRAQLIAKAFLCGALHGSLAALLYLCFVFPLTGADIDRMRLARRSSSRRREDFQEILAPMAGGKTIAGINLEYA